MKLIDFAVLNVLMFTGCGGSNAPKGGNGLIPIRLQADWYPQPEQGGFYTALAKGYYQAAGLDVSIFPLGQYSSALKVVSSGGAEFGLASSDQILEAVANGLPVVAVGATMQHDPQAIMLHKDSPVKDFAGLEGKSIAAQPGSTWFKYIVSKYKLKDVRETPATHSVANFLADPNYIQQIFITSEPFFVKNAGVAYRTMLISDSGYDPYRLFFVHKQYMEQQPEATAKFVRASIQGWQEYLRDPAPANALITKLNPAQNSAQIEFTLKALKDGAFITGADGETGKMTAERWTALNEQLLSLGVLRKRIDATTAYTTKFLP